MAIHVFATFVVFMSFTSVMWVGLIGAWAYGTIAAAIVIGCIALILRVKPDLRWWQAPKAVGLLIAAELLTVLWLGGGVQTTIFGLSAVIGVAMVALFFAFCLSWQELLRALDVGLRWVIGLSLAWELIAAIFVRRDIRPPNPRAIFGQPVILSDSSLFHGGPIEGVTGYELLGLSALLGIIVWGIRFAGTTRRGWYGVWIVLALITLGLTRSPSSVASAVMVAMVVLLALWARDLGEGERKRVYVVVYGLIVVGVVLGIVFMEPLKSVFIPGGGPVGSDESAGLADVGNTPVDNVGGWPGVWQQLNIVIVVLLALVFVSTLWRSWFHAVDRPRRAAKVIEPYRASSLMSLLIVTLLLAQSFTGNLLLAEAGSVLLIAFATKTKLDATGP